MSKKNRRESSDTILIEARRLYEIGLGVHWIREDSKMPVKAGWNGPQRDNWKTLLAEYRKGYGLGVRIGASTIGTGYLGVVDMDIRSPEPRHYQEAIDVIDRYFPRLRETAPFVLTGRGLGSAHFYSRSSELVPNKNLGRSSEMVKVYSPSSEISGEQKSAVTRGNLTSANLAEGYRMKAAWEVDLMGAGKQIVVPPSLHPDTGRRYRWGKDFT